MTKTAVDYARDPSPQVETDLPEPIGDDRFRLRIEDLMPGANGEIVLFNDSALREVVIEASMRPSAQGLVEDHVTAEGVDVSGYRYMDLGDGVVIYYDADTVVTIEDPSE